MSDLIHLKTISDLYRFLKLGFAEHPLVAVVDFSKLADHATEDVRIKPSFYSILFKNYCRNHIRYGRKALDFQDGSLVCIAPNHIVTIDNDIEVNEDMLGWGLFFHPDFIRGTSLGGKMREYTFFSYEISEALHLSDKEKQLLYECILKIQVELTQNMDGYSQDLIVSNIELLLNYCARYYSRQFFTRKNANLDVVSKVDHILRAYFENEETRNSGVPTVKELAGKVNLSPNYLSDLLKRETGLNAQDHIHYFIIEQAKNILMQTNQSVSEVAFSLGFEYPQYFSRLFKQKTGKTPLEYRFSH
ncbi:MAG: helix-turn-helix transcriptional regulator [Saprospiraceae bacterium]|nr:helix-turn-helix transcriptional regulator [Saprospiraceae bacterium]